jgi:hypothetical protein
MRKYILLFAIFITPLAAIAATGPQLHNSDVFFGYSRTGSDTFYQGTGGLNGWEGTLHVHMAPVLGGEADVAEYGVGASSSTPHTTTVLFGPRLTVKAAGVALFAHGLVGVDHTANSGSGGNFGPVSQTGLGYALGGGVDIPFFPFFAWRFQGDRISSTDSPSEGTKARFTTGLVFRF